MKITKQRTIALSTLGVLTASTLAGAFTTPAHADADLWKKIAIGAGAATAYGLVKKNGKVATIGGIAAVGSYLKYKSDKKKEDKENAKRVQWYKSRYGSTWRNHYKPGV
jgi:uncharacterized membrane protein YebE (DUF533 family)